MKSIAEKKKTTVSKAKTGSKGVKVSFHLRYKTHFGQGIYIYGNHPQLGNHSIDHAVPLVFLNNDYWVLHLDMDLTTTKEKVVYHYYIQNEDGKVLI
jgi:hypothetical protein